MRRIAIAAGALVFLAGVAFLGWRRLTYWDRASIDWLRPVDDRHALVGKDDFKGDRLELSLVDESGRAAWSQVVAYGRSTHVAEFLVETGSWVGADTGTGLVAVGPRLGLDLADGHERWRNERVLGPDEMRLSRLQGGQVLVVMSGEASTVIALDASSGNELWRARADTGGLVRWYRLFDDAVLIAGERAALIDRRTGSARDPGLGDAGAKAICSIERRVFALTSAGALLALDIGETRARTLSSELGKSLCPEPCQALACASWRDEVVLASSRLTRNAVLPTSVRLVAFEANSGAPRWQLELPTSGRLHANADNEFADFVPLRGRAPRFVPFRVGGEIVMVDLERHAVASRTAGSRASNGWSLEGHEGRYYARDDQRLGVFDGETGALAASVHAYARTRLAGERVWLQGYDRVGQLDARTLEPRPGSEGLIQARAAGGWVPGW